MRYLHCVLCALLILSAFGCAHLQPKTSRYVLGRPRDYYLPSATQERESLAEFTGRVRRLQAQALAARTRTVIPTVEMTDPRLRASLLALAGQPTADNHRRVALEYLRLGIRDTAADHLTAAIRLEPGDASSFDLRARVWRDWGFPGVGLSDAHRAVFHAPRSPAVHNTLGTMLHRLGRYADARREYERALALDDQAGYALNNLCALDLLEGDAEGAAAKCSKALAIDPAASVAQRNLDRANALAASTPGDHHAQR